MEEGNYRFLRASERIFEVLCWVFLVLFVLNAFIILFGGGGADAPKVGGVVGSLVLGGIFFLVFKTIGGVIRLLLEIESRIRP